MARNGGLRIGLCVLAIALLGAAAIEPGFAEEVGSSAHGGSKPFGVAKGKAESSATRNFHRRMFSASGASTRTERNAIGVPILQHESTVRHDGEHPGITGDAAGNGGLAKTEDGLGRPTALTPSAHPHDRSIAPNRGVIDGTAMTRPGRSPSGVGGPAKAVAGINGTTIRPKH
jgi:hypothetical protein